MGTRRRSRRRGRLGHVPKTTAYDRPEKPCKTRPVFGSIDPATWPKATLKRHFIQQDSHSLCKLQHEPVAIPQSIRNCTLQINASCNAACATRSMRHPSSSTHDALRHARDLEGAHARRSAGRQGRRRVHAVLPLPAARRQGRPGAAAPLHGSNRPRDEPGRSRMGGPARRVRRGRLERLEGRGLVPARLRPRGLRRRVVWRRLVPVHLRRVERADGAAGFRRG